jgi:hypothetical protein
VTGPARSDATDSIDVAPGRALALADATLDRQVAALTVAVSCNPTARAVLDAAAQLDLPDWYLGAGAVVQTVWNLLHGEEPDRGIKDYDLVYFEPGDLSVEGEAAVEASIRRRLDELGVDGGSDADVELDVHNEAGVHLWYAERFGRSIPPYRSSEHAISTWPTTASSIAVRGDRAGRLSVYAPFGLSDLFAMVVRPNKAIVDRGVYEEKAHRWAARWPQLTVLPW